MAVNMTQKKVKVGIKSPEIISLLDIRSTFSVGISL